VRARRLLFGIGIALAGVIISTRAPAVPPRPAAPSASASASAPPAPPVNDAPLLDADPPSADKSPSPKPDEWSKATPVRLTRTSPTGGGCRAVRVREWLRIRCATKTFAVSLLGGSNEGVAFWIGPESDGQPGEIQFPLRRGDRRVFQFWAYGKDAEGGFQAKPLLVVQEQWIEGDAAPIVTAI
jgi:hypothetical protein